MLLLVLVGQSPDDVLQFIVYFVFCKEFVRTQKR
jgi:hypothetical protein